MIEYIHIERFQSHTDSMIHFSPGITAITGYSMSGKTAVKRAFEWVRKNRPTGFRFNYRYEEGPTAVKIGVDGHVVKLEKSDGPLDDEGSKARYSILYPDGNEVIFTAIGTNVPEEVTELLGISDISIQDQLDAYLLVISSAGEIARTMNRITGIDIGDAWIKEINKAITSVKRNKSMLEGSLDFQKTDLKRYEGIDELQEKIRKAMADQNQYDDDVQVYNQMVDLITKYAEAQEWVVNNQAKIDPLETLLKDFEEVEKRINYLKEKRKRINDAMMDGEALNEIRSALSFLEPKIKDFEDFEEIKGERNRIQRAIDDYRRSETLRDTYAAEIEKKKKELGAFLASIGVCWVCGGELTDIEKIMESL